MKTALLALSLSVAVFLSGCARSLAETDHEHEHMPAATYREGHGVKLSEKGAAFVALATAEFGSRALSHGTQVAAIPAAALLRTVNGDFVYVVNGDWFLRTAVKIGGEAEGWYEITEGLYEGDRVVVAGARDLWLAEVHAVNGGVGCAHGH